MCYSGRNQNFRPPQFFGQPRFPVVTPVSIIASSRAFYQKKVLRIKISKKSCVYVALFRRMKLSELGSSKRVKTGKSWSNRPNSRFGNSAQLHSSLILPHFVLLPQLNPSHPLDANDVGLPAVTLYPSDLLQEPLSGPRHCRNVLGYRSINSTRTCP